MSFDPNFNILIYGYLRAFGMCALLPFGEGLGGFGKRGVLAGGLALFMLLQGQGTSTANFHVGSGMIEFFAGLLLGLPFALLVNCLEMWAELIESNRGQTIASFYDPLSMEARSPLIIFQRQYAWLVLFMAGGFERLFEAYLTSEKIIGFGQVGWGHMITASPVIISHTLIILAMSISLFIPCALLMLLADIGGMFIAKMISNIGMQNELFLLKTGVSYALLMVLFREDFFTKLLLFPNPLSFFAKSFQN